MKNAIFWRSLKHILAIEVATLGSCEFLEVADGQACKKPNKPQTLAFYMYKATRLRHRMTPAIFDSNDDIHNAQG